MQGLSAVAARLEPKDAAAVAVPAAATLAQAMKDAKNPYFVSLLAQGLSAVVARMEPKDGRTTLTRAMKDTNDPEALYWLAQGLSAVGGDAALAATVLVNAMKNAKDPKALLFLAQGLSALEARLEAEDAAAVTSQAVIILFQHPMDTPLRASALSALLTGVAPAEMRSRATTAAAVVALPAGAGPTFTALYIPVAELPPCRLSTQQLVELLKMPPCIGEVRHVVLDRLGNRYRRSFSDVWEFVRYATEQHLDLDFTSPFSRPEAEAATPKP